MDLGADAADALGLNPSPSTSTAAPLTGAVRPSKFQPKFKGKVIKQEPSAASVTTPHPLLFIKKVDDGGGDVITKNEITAPAPVEFVADATENHEEGNCDYMDIAEGRADVVVREIDVFFKHSPIDEHTQLYVTQYPLRPSWRPYNLNEMCEEVRMKPKQSKIEVDLSLDPDSQNYCQDISGPLRLQKQTLSSSMVPFAAHCAIGLLSGNKLYLSHVDAVVQLRPLMGHLNSSVQQKKKVSARSSEGSTKSTEKTAAQSSRPSSMQGTLVSGSEKEAPDDPELWVSLEYYEMGSHVASRYQQKMVAAVNNTVQFSTKPYDYIDILCGSPSGNCKTSGLSLRMSLLSLPLEERLRSWFQEGPQVNTFTAIMHLAPADTSEDVIKLLPRYACLVQGLWVSKSSLQYGQQLEILARDFILYHFNVNHVIQKDKLKPFSRVLDKLMAPIARERPLLNDWKFKEAKDISFVKKHPDIVREQEAAWSARYKEVMEGLRNLSRNSQRPDPTKRCNKVEPNKVNPEHNKAKDVPVSLTTPVKGALHKAVLELYEEIPVLSQSVILMKLREKAVAQLASLPKEDPRAKVALAVTNGASFLQPVLDSILREIAVNIHGVYVLQSGKNPEHDALRKVVIKLFQGKQLNGTIRKDEIRQAVLLELKRDMKDAECQQVVTELCDQVARGTWALKRGSGNKN